MSYVWPRFAVEAATSTCLGMIASWRLTNVLFPNCLGRESSRYSLESFCSSYCRLGAVQWTGRTQVRRCFSSPSPTACSGRLGVLADGARLLSKYSVIQRRSSRARTRNICSGVECRNDADKTFGGHERQHMGPVYHGRERHVAGLASSDA